VLARGTLGVHHCFHGRAGEVVVVADDPSIVAAVAGASPRLDERAVAEFLAMGQRESPILSFHRGVKRVPAAHTVVIERDGRERCVRHWSLPEPARRRANDPRMVVEEFLSILDEAVRDRLRAPRAAVLLSGGLDSL
jgi:asparagine synthase (glutamine-hydrolysing)